MSEDDSSESDDNSENFNADARQMYEEWLKEQPKQNIKIMAVMFMAPHGFFLHMGTLIDRFNMTTRGAANEVGLV